LSLFSFTGQNRYRSNGAQICHGRLELLGHGKSTESTFHRFLNELSLLGFKTTRISIFEVPLQAVLEFAFEGSSDLAQKNTFQLDIERSKTAAGKLSVFEFQVKSVGRNSIESAELFTNALENTCLNNTKVRKMAIDFA